MRKKLVLYIMFVALLCFGIAIPNIKVKAESNYIADSYSIEISESKVRLPVPDVPDTWAYSITLKHGETVLDENATEYLFTQTGEYTLVYHLHKNGSPTDIVEEVAILRVVDTQNPTLTTEGYDEEYFVGDTLVILPAQVKDNVDKELTSSVTLYCGEEQLSIVNSSFVFSKTGNYTLTYTATDKSGNEGMLSYAFTVYEKAIEGESGANNGCASGGCSGNILAGGGIAILIGVIICALLIGKKQNKIKNGGERNEN